MAHVVVKDTFNDAESELGEKVLLERIEVGEHVFEGGDTEIVKHGRTQHINASSWTRFVLSVRNKKGAQDERNKRARWLTRSETSKTILTAVYATSNPETREHVMCSNKPDP